MTIMDMCETQKLADITVANVVEQAGTAKQTFYNHFADINDLICYTASKPIFREGYRYADPELTRHALTESLRHRRFFCQLGTLHGQNNYWETYLAWVKHYYYELENQTACDELDVQTRQLRRVRIDLFLGGVVEVLRSWYDRGAQEPVDMLVQAFYESMPDFIRDRLADAPAVDPNDYPR